MGGSDLASLVALVVKNSPANVEDVKDMGSIPDWENPLEESMAVHSSILENPIYRGAWWATVHS